MAREKYQPDDASDTKQAEVDGIRRTAIDAQEETNRFYVILSEHLQVQHTTLHIKLSSSTGKEKVYPLFPKNDKNDPVRAWAIERYAALYPDEKEPLVRSYNLARSRIERDIDIPEPAQEEEKEEGFKGRKGKRAQKYAGIIQSVEELQDWIVSSRKVGIQYARVPYKEEHAAFTGIWRLDPENPEKLLDCAVYFKDINRPHATSKSMDYSGTLVVINGLGEQKEISFTRDELEDKGLDAKLVAFADWPHVPTEKYRLLEALKLLMREKCVSVHDQFNTLGWIEHNNLGLCWLANNGIETAQGFLPAEQSPFIAPTLLSPGNGYRALSDLPEKPEFSSHIWELLLNDLNPDNWARMYAKLGATMRVIFPEGTVERAGKLDFVIETVGDGSGQGKSTEDNFVLSLFGADFDYNRPPLISTDDTGPFRPRIMEAMRYLPFMTEDRKARENNPQFLKQHETRKKLIEQYADNTGGGGKMGAYGAKMLNRGNPQGLPLLTGNADHSAYAFKDETGGEEMTEWRACTFILKPGEKADGKISVLIGTRRHELTAWGTYERQWFMQQHNADKTAFMLRVQAWRAKAIEIVDSFTEEWHHSRVKNMCIDILWGMFARQAFLEDMLPDSYKDHFFWQWIETLTIPFLENRLERAKYLQSLLDSRHDALDLGDFVLDTLRFALGTGQYYIASQQSKFLEPNEVPLSLSKMGMVLDQTLEGNEIWRRGVHGIIGYYLSRKDAIALNFDILYPFLVNAANKKYPLPSKAEFKRKFAETGIPVVKRDEYGEIVRADSSEWINGKAGQYITIPLSKLYPEPEINAQDEKEELLEEIENVTPIRRPEPVTVGVKATMNGHQTNEPVARVRGIDFSISEDEIPEVD